MPRRTPACNAYARAHASTPFSKLAPVLTERCKRSPTRLVVGHCETEEGPLGRLQVGKASRRTGMNEDAEPEILTYRAYRERETLLEWRRRQRAYEQSRLSHDPEWEAHIKPIELLTEALLRRHL